MKEVFEPVPLLVAALIGAGLVWVYSMAIAEPVLPATSNTNMILIGAAVGAGVQIGVRLTGVS